MYHADPVEHAARYYDKLDQKDEAFQRYKKDEELQFWRDIRDGNYKNAIDMFWWEDRHKIEFTQRAIIALLAASGTCKHCRAVINDMAEIYAHHAAEQNEIDIAELEEEMFGKPITD